MKVFARELAFTSRVLVQVFIQSAFNSLPLKPCLLCLTCTVTESTMWKYKGIVVASVFYSDSKLEFSSILFTIFSRLNFVVDDGTGIVDCVLWVNKMATKLKDSIAAHIVRGTLVTVQVCKFFFKSPPTKRRVN